MATVEVRSTGENSRDRQGRSGVSLRVMTPLCLAAFVGVTNVLGPAPFLDDLAGDLDSSVPLVGQAVSIALLTSALVGLVAGPLADHAGHRRMLLAGCIFAGLSALGSAVAPGYLTFMTTRALVGVGSSITIGVSFGAASTLYRGAARRRALSLIGASLSLGTALGPLFLTTASLAVGWRGAFMLIGGLAALSFALMLALFPAEEPHGNGRFKLGRILDSYRPLLGDQPMLLIYAVWATRAICWLGLLSFVGAFFDEQYDYSTRTVGLVFLVAGGGYFAGTVAAGGRLGDFNPRMQALLSLLGMATGVGLLFATPAGAIAGLGFLILTSVANGVFQVSVLTMAADRSPAGPSTTMVLTETVLSVGAALGGALGGLLLGTGGFAAMGVGLSLTVLVGAVLIARREGRLSIPPVSQPT